MANQNAFLQTFAGGEFGDAMSARVGIESYQSSCELMENWFCQAQGPMSRRPALEHIASFVDHDDKGVLKSFQFDVGQNYVLQLTDQRIDLLINDGRITIPTTTAAVSNGTFSNFTGWTDNSDSGASAGASGGVMTLTSGAERRAAKARTTFAINQNNTLHVLAFDVVNGPVNLRLGSSAGGEQFASFLELRTGHHRLSFTPTSGTGHIEFWSADEAVRRVDNVAFVNGPTFHVPAPWAEADMRGIYTAQDGDRLFMFHRDYAPRVLERRAHQSWSLIYFEPNDGPFDIGDDSITMAPSARTGEVTITASRNYFAATDVRRLLRLTQNGQSASIAASSDIVFSEPIKVSGVGIDRSFNLEITGTWVGTIKLQRSIGNTNDFVTVLSYTGNISALYNDSWSAVTIPGAGTDQDLYDVTSDNTPAHMDNIVAYYRLAVTEGSHISGTMNGALTYIGGSTVGLARIIGFTNATTVTAEVIEHFARTGATDIWDIGAWVSTEEWPNVVAFSSGRLWTARRRRLWASVVDDFFSFEDGVDADRAIDIILRSKSAEGVRWMRHLDFLAVGTANEEYIMRSGSASEPISPNSIDAALMSEEGGAGIEAQIGGDSILYVHRSLRRVLQYGHNPRALSETSFISTDLNRLNPESVEDQVVNVAIQQEPERRIYAVLKSGVVKTALFRREEDIVAWQTMRTERGVIEDVCVFPENDIDAVYFIVRRYFDGAWTRSIERMASEIILNDEDRVHLDAMLSTEIERPDTQIIFPALTWVDNEYVDQTNVAVQSSEDAFEAGDVNRHLWAGGGRFLITARTDARNILVTILNYPIGIDDPDNENMKIMDVIPAGRWGMADVVTSVSGLDHLEGQTVQVWADCAYYGTAVVDSGEVAIPEGASRVFAGKRMISKWKGLKLAYAAQKGTAVLQKKQVNQMGFVLRKTADGLKFGQNFKTMKELTLSTPSVDTDMGRLFTGEVHAAFNGRSETDPRLTIQVDTPGPATIVGLVPNVQVNER
jgi:hypothetical protein